MDYLTRHYMFNRVGERGKNRTVIFHPDPLHVDDHDSESKLLEIVLMLKTLEAAPFGFGHS